MNEKKNKYQKRFDFQQKMISRQSEQIESLKLEIEKLNLKLIEKDELINSVEFLRKELKQNVDEIKRGKEEYRALINELKQMEKIVNQEIYKGRWHLVKWLIK